jgi:hypothetical protein
MSETRPEIAGITDAFDVLGRITDRLGCVTMRKVLGTAQARQEQGAAGPAIRQVLASDKGPAYSLAFQNGEVSFALGGESGQLPVTALESLVATAEAAAEEAAKAAQAAQADLPPAAPTA